MATDKREEGGPNPSKPDEQETDAWIQAFKDNQKESSDKLVASESKGDKSANDD